MLFTNNNNNNILPQKESEVELAANLPPQSEDHKETLNDLSHHTHHITHQPYIYLMAINAALGTLFFGYNLGVYNGVQLVMQKINSWDSTQYTLYTAIITAATPCGALIGALLNKYTVEFFKGIRRSMIFFDILAIIGTTIIILDTTLPNLIIGRFICGICIGQNTALTPLYINDYTPKEIRGQAGTINQFFQAFGVFLSYIITLVLPVPSNLKDGYSDGVPWRIALGLPMAAPLIRFLVLMTCFRKETPSVMMRQHSYTDLKSYIHLVYKPSECDEVFHEFEQQIQAEDEQKLHHQEKHNQDKLHSEEHHQKPVAQQNFVLHRPEKSDMNIINAQKCDTIEIKNDSPDPLSLITIHQNNKKTEDDFFHDKIFDLCSTQSYPRRFLLGSIIQFTTQSCGVNAIVFYSNSIFKSTSGETGADADLFARYATIGMGAAMVSYNFISFFLQGKLGRRTLMLFGTTVILFANFIFGGINTTETSKALGIFGIVLLYLFQFGWQLSLGAVTWIFNPEILDHTGMAVSSAIRWATAMTIGLVFPYMIIYCHLSGSFFIFGGFTISALVYFIFFMLETKGKDRFEIMKQYCNSKKYESFHKEAQNFAKQAIEQSQKSIEKSKENPSLILIGE